MKYEKIFLAIIFPLTYLISILFLLKGLNGASAIIMVLPALAAVVSILIESKSLIQLIKPFSHKISVKSLAFTLFFPIAIILLCVYLTQLTKQGALLTNWNNFAIRIGTLVLVSIIFFITGLLEEYGWRGYLLPRLIEKYNLKKANYIICFIVVCYNIPSILILNLNYGIKRAIMYTLLQSTSIFAMNYAFTYLFTLSKNVVLPSIMNTLWNNLNLGILGYSYKILPACGYVIGRPHIINGEGLFGLIFFSIFALWAHRKFSKNVA